MRQFFLFAAAPVCLLLPLTAILLQLHGSHALTIFGIDTRHYMSLSRRLQALGREVDGDHNGIVSHGELAAWARTLGQAAAGTEEEDEANCVTDDEFVAGLEENGFSTEFAESYTGFLAQFPEGVTQTCDGLDTQALENAEGSDDDDNDDDDDDDNNSGEQNGISVRDFLGGFLTRLTAFCEAGHARDYDFYVTNRDCAGLPVACVTAPYGCEKVCLNYTLVTTRGRVTCAFSERAQMEAADTPRGGRTPFIAKLAAMFRDEDEDGSFSGEEQERNYRDNYDINADGCVDEVEFKARMTMASCGGFSFSEAFADAKFRELRTTAAASQEEDGSEQDSAPQEEDGSEQDSAPQEEDGSDQDSAPQEEDGSEQDSAPQEEDGSEQDSAPQEEDGSEQDSAPQEEDGSEQDSAPQEDDGSEQDSAPQEDDGSEQDSASQEDDGSEQDSAPQEEDGSEQDSAPQEDDGSEQDSAPQEDDGSEQDSAPQEDDGSEQDSAPQEDDGSEQNPTSQETGSQDERAAAVCQGIRVTDPDREEMSEERFIEVNLRTLISLCEGDTSLYETNTDCKDLLIACKVNPAVNQRRVCQEYRRERDPSVSEPSLRIFRGFEKYGWSYEDLFGRSG